MKNNLLNMAIGGIALIGGSYTIYEVTNSGDEFYASVPLILIGLFCAVVVSFMLSKWNN